MTFGGVGPGPGKNILGPDSEKKHRFPGLKKNPDFGGCRKKTGFSQKKNIKKV